MNLRNLRYRQLMRYINKTYHSGYIVVGNRAIDRFNRQALHQIYRRNHLRKIGRL